MNNGKRVRQNGRKNMLIVLALVLVLCAAGGTIAWLATNTNSVTNTFVPAKVTNEVEEKNEGKVKKNVAVKNTGEIDVYIRAAVIVNWVEWVEKDDGTKEAVVCAGTPALGTDYTWKNVNDLATTGWKKGSDGYYYYTNRVASKASTGYLITECAPVGSNENGYELRVTIVAESIQADGMSGDQYAVEAAWPVVTVNKNYTLTVN